MKKILLLTLLLVSLSSFSYAADISKYGFDDANSMVGNAFLMDGHVLFIDAVMYDNVSSGVVADANELTLTISKRIESLFSAPDIVSFVMLTNVSFNGSIFTYDQHDIGFTCHQVNPDDGYYYSTSFLTQFLLTLLSEGSVPSNFPSMIELSLLEKSILSNDYLFF